MLINMIKNGFIVFEKPRRVVIKYRDLPKPSGKQILVKTSMTLISTGTELTVLSGDFPPKSAWAEYGKYPFIPGYSNVGIVVEKGREVKDIDIGDRVASTAPHSQYALISSKDVVKIPDKVSDEEAVFHTIAIIVMNSVRLARISLGDCVIVMGVGLLGQFAIIFSKLCGGFPIIAVDLSEKRLRLAKISGATKTIIGNNIYDKIYELTDGRFADIVFEVTGNPKVIPKAIRLLRPLGKFIVLSSPRGPTLLDFHDEVNRPSRIIIGTHNSSHPLYETPYNPWTMKRNRELFFKLLENKIIDVKHLITHRYWWMDADKAYSMLLKNRTQAMGVILDFKK
ncbi:MAG: hypothetical protein DRJ45_00420 [Thermoprotei archaeon]|nr:MAG: hypothetical protein DRJ45_00420 [Thermoprotei archaeon]